MSVVTVVTNLWAAAELAVEGSDVGNVGWSSEDAVAVTDGSDNPVVCEVSNVVRAKVCALSALVVTECPCG